MTQRTGKVSGETVAEKMARLANGIPNKDFSEGGKEGVILELLRAGKHLMTEIVFERWVGERESVGRIAARALPSRRGMGRIKEERGNILPEHSDCDGFKLRKERLELGGLNTSVEIWIGHGERERGNRMIRRLSLVRIGRRKIGGVKRTVSLMKLLLPTARADYGELQMIQ